MDSLLGYVARSGFHFRDFTAEGDAVGPEQLLGGDQQCETCHTSATKMVKAAGTLHGSALSVGKGAGVCGAGGLALDEVGVTGQKELSGTTFVVKHRQNATTAGWQAKETGEKERDMIGGRAASTLPAGLPHGLHHAAPRGPTAALKPIFLVLLTTEVTG